MIEIRELHNSVRVLKQEVAVKDSYVARLRIDAPEVEQLIAQLQTEGEKLDRVRRFAARVPFGSAAPRLVGTRLRNRV